MLSDRGVTRVHTLAGGGLPGILGAGICGELMRRILDGKMTFLLGYSGTLVCALARPVIRALGNARSLQCAAASSAALDRPIPSQVLTLTGTTQCCAADDAAGEVRRRRGCSDR